MTLADPVDVIFLGDGPVVVRGRQTGLTYLFGAREPLPVDRRDVAALIASGHFAHAPAPTSPPAAERGES